MSERPEPARGWLRTLEPNGLWWTKSCSSRRQDPRLLCDAERNCKRVIERLLTHRAGLCNTPRQGTCRLPRERLGSLLQESRPTAPVMQAGAPSLLQVCPRKDEKRMRTEGSSDFRASEWSSKWRLSVCHSHTQPPAPSPETLSCLQTAGHATRGALRTSVARELVPRNGVAKRCRSHASARCHTLLVSQ